MTMTFDKHNLTFDSDLQLFGTDSVANDVAHVLCEQGCFYFTFDGRPFCLKRHEGMIIGIQHLVEVIGRSDDLKVYCIYVNSQFLEVCSPHSNYGIRGSLSLFVNPIIPLSESMFHRIKLDFQQIYNRYQDEEHQFMADVMMASTQLLFLDFFDVHAQLYGQVDDVTTQHALLIDRFISLLEQGSYVRHRASSFIQISCSLHRNTYRRYVRLSVGKLLSTGLIDSQPFTLGGCLRSMNCRSSKFLISSVSLHWRISVGMYRKI